MNNINLNDERYLVIENPKENLDHLYSQLMDVLPERLSGFKSLPQEEFIKAVSNYLELGTNSLKWIDFQIAHRNEKVVWDTETGEMFTI